MYLTFGIHSKKSGKTLGKTIVAKLLCNRIGQHQ